MDVFPTVLNAAGGALESFEIDGTDLMPNLSEGRPLVDRAIFWEMGQQTAVRRGPWKLVLNGQLVEGAPTEDDVHLADVTEDIGERRNLAADYPELADELRSTADEWRLRIERRWETEWLPATTGTTALPASE
jgi:arylsulfatase A-like enzyme